MTLPEFPGWRYQEMKKIVDSQELGESIYYTEIENIVGEGFYWEDSTCGR